MPTRELYMQKTQEQQLPGIEPPPGRLKTSALTIGPSMSLAHRAAQLAQGGAFMGGHIELGLRKQPYRLNQVRDGGGHEATETGFAYAPVSQAHGHNHIVQCYACCTAA